jgi:hypothetical protein
MIVRQFDTVMEHQNTFLLSMPKQYLKRLFESDNLHIPNEYCLVELISEVIESSKECTFLVPQHPSDLIRPEIWALLSKPEQDARIKVYTAENAAITKKNDEEMKVDAVKYETLNNLERIQFLEDRSHNKFNEVIKGRLHREPFTDEWKLNMFKTIRWAFMTHEQLVNVSRNPEFVLAKDMVLTALSCRLDCYDTFKKEELGFSITPRTQYCPIAKNDASIVSDV